MHIAVDCDDVMLDFMGSVMRSFELEFGITPDWDGGPWSEDAVKFTTHPAFAAAGYEDWWAWLTHRDWLWALFPAIPGAIGGVKRLRHDGHYLEMVTSKPEWAEPQVWRWLGKWRPAFNAVTIVANGQSKLDYTEAELIIDDRHKTCREFVAAGRRAVNFDRSSSPAEPSFGLWVAHDWTEVLDIVGSLNA